MNIITKRHLRVSDMVGLPLEEAEDVWVVSALTGTPGQKPAFLVPLGCSQLVTDGEEYWSIVKCGGARRRAQGLPAFVVKARVTPSVKKSIQIAIKEYAQLVV